MDRLEGRMDGLEGRMGNLEHRMDTLETDMTEVKTTVNALGDALLQTSRDTNIKRGKANQGTGIKHATTLHRQTDRQTDRQK